MKGWFSFLSRATEREQNMAFSVTLSAAFSACQQ